MLKENTYSREPIFMKEERFGEIWCKNLKCDQ